MNEDQDRCELYPKLEDETCVCSAGSDISGAGSEICTVEYSKSCQWFRLFNERKKKEKL